MRNRRPHPQQIRSALFGLADARGNNPHGTRETADHEGRRLNAGRYETVGQIDRELDARARRPPQGVRLGEVEPASPQGGGLFGTLALLALGAGFTYLMLRKDEDEDVEVGDEAEFDDVDIRRNPAPAPAPTSQPAPSPVVVVMPPPALAAASPPPVAVAVPTVVQPPVEKRKRRSRSRASSRAGVSGAVLPIEPV